MLGVAEELEIPRHERRCSNGIHQEGLLPCLQPRGTRQRGILPVFPIGDVVQSDCAFLAGDRHESSRRVDCQRRYGRLMPREWEGSPPVAEVEDEHAPLRVHCGNAVLVKERQSRGRTLKGRKARLTAGGNAVHSKMLPST